MKGLHSETRLEANASFTVGNRVFYVVCEVRVMTAFGGKAWGATVTPKALLVEEGGRLYQISLTGAAVDVEEMLASVPSLKEKIRSDSGSRSEP